MTKAHDSNMLKRVNLNLLNSLYAILSSDSLTQAAEKVSLTQPAISQALKKLRAAYNDQLFYQEGGERRLTPLAEALKPRVKQALQEAREAFDLRLDFDPAQSTRTFTIAASESILTMFLGPFVSHLRSIAPGVRLSFVKLDPLQQANPLDRGADLRVGPRLGSDIGPYQRLLCGDYMVGLAWRRNSTFGDTISLEQLATAGLVGSEGGLLPTSLLSRSIRDVIDERGFEVTTDSLASVPAILVGSDLIALTSCWLAQYYAAFHPLKLLALPREATNVLHVVADWHPRHADDPAIMWLVDHLFEGAQRFGVAVDAIPSDLTVP